MKKIDVGGRVVTSRLHLVVLVHLNMVALDVDLVLIDF
jgi:hypothetical protein